MTMSFGERVMSRATRVPNLRDNQMSILRWLASLGHEIDDEEFFWDLLDEDAVWIVRNNA